ncbi:nucleoside triphosphate pyrophosphohydrolase [bacterium]|nr:nucleoside triphosphate pyrophosphohydrolase [bacterium]
MECGRKFARFVEIVEKLRGENGCPWDREQDYHSMKPYLIEEVYEAIEAVDKNDYQSLREELGDILLHIVFFAQMAREEQQFGIEDVIESISQKIIKRHPHVFGTTEVSTSAEVLQNWEKIKLAEREEKDVKASILDGVPDKMPALLVAQRIQERASRVGFDWDNSMQVMDKIKEELAELEMSIREGDKVHQQEELGDLLFAITNFGRFMNISSEMALRATIDKFRKRFRYIEQKLKGEEGLKGATLTQMDAIWDEAKKKNI